MQRVILDTNIFEASAFNRTSAAARILDAVREGKLLLVWNEDTRRETRSVLQQIPRLRWSDVESLFREEGQVREETDPSAFSDLVPDPDDRKFAALARVSGAPIISNDDHLLSMDEEAGITVLRSSHFERQHLRGE
jgi:uncharacterized protein